MSLGNIPFAGEVSKMFMIHFTNDVKPWTQVRWKAEGKLTNAIDVFQSKERISEDTLALTIKIDGNLLSPSDKGFVNSYIHFFENDPNDKGVKLLLYGYR